MARYRDGWMLVTAVTATVGVWTALQTWPLLGVLGAFVCVAFVGGSLAEAARPERGRRRLRPIAAVAGLSGLSAVAAAGLMAMSGLLGLLVVAVLAITCPQVWSVLRRRRPTKASWPTIAAQSPEQLPETGTGTATIAAARVEDPEPPSDVPEEPWLLDDQALCCAWRRSYVILERPHSPATHLMVAQRRQLYLDELERRNPTGLAEWLASGARAAGDPTRFIVGGS
ncbi:MAG: hypothetical protein ACRDO0_00525 [Nocardioidaceae bacterium]